MIYLLIAGAPNTGKTETVYDIGALLSNFGYQPTSGIFVTPRPAPVTDFTCIMDGVNINGAARKVLVNSPSDLTGNIENLKRWIDDNPAVDVIITSVRDGVDPMRIYMFSHLAINPATDTVIEIPLAKITRKNNFPATLNWYRTSIINLLAGIIRQPALNL